MPSLARIHLATHIMDNFERAFLCGFRSSDQFNAAIRAAITEHPRHGTQILIPMLALDLRIFIIPLTVSTLIVNTVFPLRWTLATSLMRSGRLLPEWFFRRATRAWLDDTERVMRPFDDLQMERDLEHRQT